MSKFNYNQIQGLQGNANVTEAFITAVEEMAERLETKPQYILAAMSFETGGTFSPSITNPIGATGLIQFLKPTAIHLGTTTAALRAMTSVEQLEFVEKYFKGFKGRLGTLEAVYTSILSGSPKKPDDVLFTEGTPAYRMNPLDWNRDGIITAREAATPVAARLFGGVKAVQRRLLELGIVPDELKIGFDDSNWGKNTTDVLAKFQKSKGLTETGLMDEATGNALFSIVEGEDPNSSTTAIKVLERNSEGDAVKVMQGGLVSLGYMNMDKIGTGFGKFGPMTQTAVETFQKDLGLEVTSKFGEIEHKALGNIKSGIGKGNPNTQIVKAIQNRLVKAGFMTQTQVDTGFGTFGGQTERAVKKFQGDNLLQESGVVEAVTFNVLFTKALPDKSSSDGFSVAEDGEHYTVVKGILMTDALKPKVAKVADIYFAKRGTGIVITSGYRPPERQAPAMFNKIVKEGELKVRNLYRNKGAIDQILNAFRANKGNEAAAIKAMTETIVKQVKSGIFISNHLRSNAIDVRITANKKALTEAVTKVGGRIVLELDHYHLELH